MAKYAVYMVTDADCGHVYKLYYRQIQGGAAPCEFWDVESERWIKCVETFHRKRELFEARGATVKLITTGV